MVSVVVVVVLRTYDGAVAAVVLTAGLLLLKVLCIHGTG